MTVHDTSFLVDRLGEDCSPLQFLRELTENALKAISLLDSPHGEIVWDYFRPIYESTGIFKLSIADNGIGMTGPDMVEYINQLASGLAERGITKNYGVGAKISALPLNPAGLIYISWTSGVGHMVHLWKDTTTGNYGLKLLERPDGTFDYWAEVSDELKPEQIKSHGTVVVLVGKDDDHDTMAMPSGGQIPSRWILRYLNSRYFAFPEGVLVKAREGWEQTSSQHNSHRRVSGMRWWLDQNKEESGVVELIEARAHWWILAEGADPKGHYAPGGQVGALHKNELYEVVYGRSGIARLQSFGIIFGHARVVLYIEPTPSAGLLSSNTARSQLLLNGELIPWDQYAAEFRANMPAPLSALMERIGAGSDSQDHLRSIWDRLKAIRDLFQLSRYRAAKKGALQVDQDDERPNDDIVIVDPEPEPEPEEPRVPRTRSTSKTDRVFSAFLKAGGVPGEEMEGDEGPRVEWVSVHLGTRSSGDMEDRAAKYLEDQDLILVNADFRVFEDMINRWLERYAGVPAAAENIREVVREWFAQQLVEAVVGAKALRGSREWPGDSIKALWSEEALTAVVMPRYHVDVSIKRALGARFGSLRNAAA